MNKVSLPAIVLASSLISPAVANERESTLKHLRSLMGPVMTEAPVTNDREYIYPVNEKLLIDTTIEDVEHIQTPEIAPLTLEELSERIDVLSERIEVLGEKIQELKNQSSYQNAPEELVKRIEVLSHRIEQLIQERNGVKSRLEVLESVDTK